MNRLMQSLPNGFESATPTEQAQFFRLAAQRLEARGKITEAQVKAACLAYINHPNGDAASHGAMRAALEAANRLTTDE